MYTPTQIATSANLQPFSSSAQLKQTHHNLSLKLILYFRGHDNPSRHLLYTKQSIATICDNLGKSDFLSSFKLPPVCLLSLPPSTAHLHPIYILESVCDSKPLRHQSLHNKLQTRSVLLWLEHAPSISFPISEPERAGSVARLFRHVKRSLLGGHEVPRLHDRDGAPCSWAKLQFSSCHRRRVLPLLQHPPPIIPHP